LRPLRFAMVTTFYPPFSFGGDGMCVYQLSTALAERGHKVDVYHSEDAYRLQHPGDPETEFFEHPNISRRPLRSRRPMLSALRAHQSGSSTVYREQMNGLLDDDKYDVIHYHNVSLVGGPEILCVGHAAKLYTAHEYWLICPTHVLFAFNREACTTRRCVRCTIHAKRPPQLWRNTSLLAESMRHIDRLLMPSRFALEQHRSAGIDAAMTVLPNFVVPPSGDVPEEPVAKRPFFLFVGRLEKLKGVQDLIELYREYSEADLLIVGDGGYRQKLESLAQNIDNVKFIGPVHPSRLGAYYKQAIAVLVPSLCYEVFPLIPAESFLHRTPGIARRICALTEVVEQSGGGYKFSNQDECKAAMERLRVDPTLRRELGERGRTTTMASWTTDAHLNRYLSIVDEVLEQRQQGDSNKTVSGSSASSR
jgi:glycosyltransferase involved in cell wall biosynthesis